MKKGSVNWHESGLATIMLLVGAGFAVLGLNGNLTLFFTGLFYAAIGMRGLYAIRRRRILQAQPRD